MSVLSTRPTGPVEPPWGVWSRTCTVVYRRWQQPSPAVTTKKPVFEVAARSADDMSSDRYFTASAVEPAGGSTVASSTGSSWLVTGLRWATRPSRRPEAGEGGRG